MSRLERWLSDKTADEKQNAGNSHREHNPSSREASACEPVKSVKADNAENGQQPAAFFPFPRKHHSNRNSDGEQDKFYQLDGSQLEKINALANKEEQKKTDAGKTPHPRNDSNTHENLFSLSFTSSEPAKYFVVVVTNRW